MNRFSLYSPGTEFVATVHFHGLGLGGSLVNIFAARMTKIYKIVFKNPTNKFSIWVLHGFAAQFPTPDLLHTALELHKVGFLLQKTHLPMAQER